MRITASVGFFSLGLALALGLGCGKHRRDNDDTDSGMEPATDCTRDPTPAGCKGGVIVQLNTCPKLTVSASPIRIAPKGRAVLTPAVWDAEGNDVTLDWTADPDGTLDTSTEPDVYYECESVGRKTIWVTATDEHDCSTERSLDIICVDPSSFQGAGSDPLQKP